MEGLVCKLETWIPSEIGQLKEPTLYRSWRSYPAALWSESTPSLEYAKSSSFHVHFSIYIVQQKFLFPHLTPPSQDAFHQSQSALEQQFDAVQKQLDSISASTEEQRKLSKTQREQVEKAVEAVERALTELKEGEERAREELKEIREEVENVRELVPKVSHLPGDAQ